jgi:hypothetical protein
MGMPAPQAITTIDGLLGLPDDGMRHKLLDGEHVVTPAPCWRRRAGAAEQAFQRPKLEQTVPNPSRRPETSRSFARRCGETMVLLYQSRLQCRRGTIEAAVLHAAHGRRRDARCADGQSLA